MRVNHGHQRTPGTQPTRIVLTGARERGQVTTGTGEPIVIGLRLNNYEIISVIGEGGMGTVYLARHTRRWSGGDRTSAVDYQIVTGCCPSTILKQVALGCDHLIMLNQN